jgi:hypothetical protein
MRVPLRAREREVSSSVCLKTFQVQAVFYLRTVLCFTAKS